MADPAKLLERYGKSEHENFYVADTIGVPHPYCVTPRHVVWASDHFGGMLGKEAIIDSEKHGGARCDICKGKLKFEEHETGLLVLCKEEILGSDGKAVPELHAYLIASKEKCEQDGYAGFAFLREKYWQKDG